MSDSSIKQYTINIIASTTAQCRCMHPSAIQSLDAQAPPMPACSMLLLLHGDAGDIYYNSLCGHAHISPPFTFEILFQNSRKKNPFSGELCSHETPVSCSLYNQN